ncbi:6031_t:CDS:2 [Entrophospora sp. SA101]|nr:6031_t:CDS:2 [Entrophospora sp. SA101]
MNTTILTSKDYVADNIKFPVWTGFHPGKVAEAYDTLKAYYGANQNQYKDLNFDEYANIDKKFIDKYGDESCKYPIRRKQVALFSNIPLKYLLAYFKGLQQPPPPSWNELQYIRFFLASPRSCMFCGIIKSTEIHWQFHTIKGHDFFAGLPHSFQKYGMKVTGHRPLLQFWEKDLIERHSYVGKYGLKPVNTYDEESKKMLEVQTKFMEECDDRNKECSDAYTINLFGDDDKCKDQKSQETCQNEHRSIEHKRKHKGINNGNKHQEKRPQTNNQLQKSQETC